MSRNSRRLRWHHTTAIALVAMTAQPAFAADQAPPPAKSDGATTGEIIVTAQFRQQKLQDTPLAITALNAAALAARGQTDISQVAAVAPNVTLKPQGQELGPGIIAFIRGVGQSDPNFALEPGVGMYIDDVYLPTLTGSLLDLADVDRIEVLRGPQGTLNGRNSLGGSIKVFSTKPKGDNSGSLEATYGRFNRIDFKGYFDTKLTDNLFVRVSASTKNHDGYVTRLDYAQTHPGSNVPTSANGADPVLGKLGGTSYTAGKIALRWMPTSRIEVNLSGDYTRERDEPGANVLLYGNSAAVFAGPSATFGARPWLAGTNGAPVPINCQFIASGANACDSVPAGYDGRYISYATYADNAPRDSQMAYKPYSTDPHSRLDNYGLAGTIDIDLGSGLKLKSITAWRHYTSDWTYNPDGAPVIAQILDQSQKNTQFSQELRLMGKALDNKLNYTLGGFYFHTRGIFAGRIDLNYAGIDFLHGPDPTPATSKAVFGNVSWEFLQGATLDAGLRSTWDNKSYVYQRHNPDGTDIQGPCTFFLQLGAFEAGGPPPTLAGPAGLGNQPNCLLFGLNGTSASFNSQKTDWRVALNYRFNDSLMVYAQASTGYRGGGVNPRPFYPSQEKSFKPETITAWEAGFKSDLFDRKLRFNATAFYNVYRNIILTLDNDLSLASIGQNTPALEPANVGNAHVKGVEIETTIRPTTDFVIDGALSYLDFKYTGVDTANTGVTPNMITPYTPNWKWNFGVQYTVHNVFKGTLTPRFDGSYQSHIYSDAQNLDGVAVSTVGAGGGSVTTQTASDRIDGYFLGNAHLAWASADKNWGVTVEVQNLFNQYYFTTKYNQYASSGIVSGAPGMPRTWSVTLRHQF